VIEAVSAVAEQHERPDPPSLDVPPDPVAPSSVDDVRSRSRRRVLISSVVGAVLGAIPFLMVLGDLRIWPARTAVGRGIFSDFYDVQARALLDGRLDVPPGSLAIEAFIVDGRHYMYFPPLPAVLRIPIFLVTDRFDGRLTTVSILVAWLVTTVMAAVLIWRVRQLLRGDHPVGRLEAAVAALALATITGGSILVFIAALPWVYHEAYAWATAMAVGTLASLIGVITRPTARRIVAVSLFALGTILTRTTSGWALALAVVAAGAWMLAGRIDCERRSRGAWLVGAGLVVLLVGGTVNWLKFRHPFMFPLERQLWTEVNAHRRQVLAENGGTLAGPQFFWSSLVNYFRPDGIRFVPYFPFITLPAEPAEAVGGVLVDQTYRTGSVPAFMPLLFLSTIWGFVVAFGRRASSGARLLRIPLLGALAITGGVMFYGYLAHRYTAEFLPVLVIGSAVGLIDVARRLEGTPRRLARPALAGLVAAGLFGAAANTAVGVTTARQTWRGDRLREFVALQDRISARTGDPIARLVSQSDELPARAPADHLVVLGDCRALYVSSGDNYEPWIPVEVRDLHIDVARRPAGSPSDRPDLLLARFRTVTTRTLWAEVGRAGRIRLRLQDGPYAVRSGWTELAPDGHMTVTIRARTEYDLFEIAVDGRLVTVTPMSVWNGDWLSVPTIAEVALAPAAAQARAGVALVEREVPNPDLCQRLLRRPIDG
jgi:hypothetical protein